jgi:hypothetical protein
VTVSRIDGHVLTGPKHQRAALLRCDMVSYPGLSPQQQREWHDRLAHFAYTAETNFTISRVNRHYPADKYVEQGMTVLDPTHGDEQAWREYLQGHVPHLKQLGAFEPEMYLTLVLPPRKRGDKNPAGPDGPDATRVLERTRAYLPARPTDLRETQWLFRRAATRGDAEPVLDVHWRDSHDHPLTPTQAVLQRLRGEAVTEHARHLIVDHDRGTTFQAMLVVGALPEATQFPGGSELLFNPLESVPFPVDAVMHCRWESNRQSLDKVRRKITEADVVLHDAIDPKTGAVRNHQLHENAALARELRADLDQPSRPPTLLVTMILAVGARDLETLEARVEALERAYGTVHLYRPVGYQAALYQDCLPRTDTGKVRAWEDRLMVMQDDGGSQFASLMPIATHAAGNDVGPHFARVLSGTNRPVRYDITAAPRATQHGKRAVASILLTGEQGSGKTMAMQLLMYQAAMRGSVVVDIDPKARPDHNLEGAPGLQGKTSTLWLSGDPEYAGMLDPLVVAPEAMREDLAASYLMSILHGAPFSWETQVRRAIKYVLQDHDPTCRRVIDRLAALEDEDARKAADALDVWADSGIAKLGFASGAHRDQRHLDHPVVCVKAGALQLPLNASGNWTSAQRIGVATFLLLTAWSTSLVAKNPQQHKVIGVDEAYSLLRLEAGHAHFDTLNRTLRSMNGTLIMASQDKAHLEAIDHLIGMRCDFELAGRCVIHDHDGRTARAQVEIVDPDLFLAFNSTPGQRIAA